MVKVRLSVAMCTYNGARFLKEQLDSIAAQTRRPDELIICDDRSLDATVKIIEAFASKAAFPVRLNINERNMGSTKNFEQATGLCSGDIIALSDQDDVWQPEKLRLIENAFLDAPGVGLVFSDAEVVAADLQPVGYRLWQSKGFGPAEQKKIAAGKSVEVLLKHNVVTGATMAFRANFRELFQPIPADWVHDGWMALIVAACGSLAAIPAPLIQYRQHLKQQIGSSKEGFFKQLAVSQRTESKTYLSRLIQYRAAHDRLLQNIQAVTDEEVIARLEGKIVHLTARCNIPRAIPRRLPVVIKELIARHYHLYANGWKSAAKDLFLT